MKKSIFILLFSIMHAIGSPAQNQLDKYSVSGKISTNIFSPIYFEGIEINSFSRKYIYSIGYNKEDEGTLFGNSPSEQYNQLNLLFGKYKDSKNDKFRFQYQGGIGRFWGTIRTNEYDAQNSTLLTNAYFTKQVSTVGLPIKIGGRYIPFNFLSIGIDMQANLNSEKSIISTVLSIEIGKLRSGKKQKVS